MQEHSAFDIAILVFTVVGAVAGSIAVLPLLGFDLRVIGRPKVPLEGITSRPERKAWLALVLVIVSLGLSAGAFYYFFHSRVTVKIVEKPVEKLVPAPCPEPLAPSLKPIPGAKSDNKRNHSESNSFLAYTPKNKSEPPQTVVNAPQGIGIAGSGTVNNPTVNNFGTPDRHLDTQTQTQLADLVIPSSVSLTILMTTDGEVQTFGSEIVGAFKGRITPNNVITGHSWNGGPPQGLTVQMHDAHESKELQDFGLRLSQVLGVRTYFNPNVPSGEVRIVIGRAP